MQNKKQLRQALRERRKTLSQTYTASADKRIAEYITGSEVFRRADTVFVYISTPQEPDTAQILQAAFDAGKAVSVPRCYGKGVMKAIRVTLDSEYRNSGFGIPEPVVDCAVSAPEEVDLAIVPCLSVNDAGIRLGHGAGYYDRWLAQSSAVTMCLCYERMKEENIPYEDHDVRMQYVVSEEGIQKGKPV